MTREERRAAHPEVDWESPPCGLVVDDVHPRSTGRCYSTTVPTRICQCGCPAHAHDMDSGQCRDCCCELLWVAA